MRTIQMNLMDNNDSSQFRQNYFPHDKQNRFQILNFNNIDSLFLVEISGDFLLGNFFLTVVKFSSDLKCRIISELQEKMPSSIDGKILKKSMESFF